MKPGRSETTWNRRREFSINDQPNRQCIMGVYTRIMVWKGVLESDQSAALVFRRLDSQEIGRNLQA